MVFHWSPSDSKSPQVSRTLLSILSILNNAVVWMVSTRPPTSKSFSPFNNPLITVPNAPITIGIIFTCIFHSFFNSLAGSNLLFTIFQFYSVVSRDNKVDNFASFLLLVDYCYVWSSGRDSVIRVYVKVPYYYHYYYYYYYYLFVCLFVCYTFWGISSFYYLLTSTLKKEIETLLIQSIYISKSIKYFIQ